jgi:hypothetical protein
MVLVAKSKKRIDFGESSGTLYVSNVGFGPPPIGLGEVARITVPPVE